eukprot:1071812-Pelagomonas_calceolata.AAC.3
MLTEKRDLDLAGGPHDAVRGEHPLDVRERDGQWVVGAVRGGGALRAATQHRLCQGGRVSQALQHAIHEACVAQVLQACSLQQRRPRLCERMRRCGCALEAEDNPMSKRCMQHGPTQICRAPIKRLQGSGFLHRTKGRRQPCSAFSSIINRLMAL